MASEPVIPPPPGVTSDLKHPQDALHTVNLVTQVLCIVIITVIVILRLVIKVRLRTRLGVEDCEYTVARSLNDS
jgi:hypothetical protein